MKTIAFIENKLTPRGTSVNLYNMAKYNEIILKNKSIIITRSLDLVKKVSPMDVTEEAYNRFKKRFKIYYYISPNEIDEILKNNNVDLAFIEKAGSTSDGLVINYCKSFIHVVFDTNDVHGTYYQPISNTVNILCNTSFDVFPNIVDVYETLEDLRKDLNIPQESTVFGTYSGKDCFNIQYIKDFVINSNKDFYFIFMNIEPFCESKSNIIFLDGTCDEELKRKFINTCDAMLYGRDGGETFGISCGEFDICNKPIICRKSERCDEHLKILGDRALLHNNYNELKNIVENFKKYKEKFSTTSPKYNIFSPEILMKQFNEIINN